MSYIIKNTSALINTRLTDVGRRRLSEGNFNISLFQVGDSEITYNSVPGYVQTNNVILMPAFNAQNDTGTPQSNKQHVKYPYFLDGSQGNTYGIPYEDSDIQEVYNTASERGFFNTGATTPNAVEITSAYTITSNYWVDMSTLSGQTTIFVDLDPTNCSPSTGTPKVNDFITIYLDGVGTCDSINTVPILTYKIQGVSVNGGGYDITLDRKAPNYTALTSSGQYARAQVYPSGMTVLYDTITPQPFWQVDTINFESPCDVIDRENTLVWNMNIPWTENPAGLFNTAIEDFRNFGSVAYVGSKEYLGYNSSSGQTDTSQVFYYNSFDEKIVVEPKDQKAIAIIHYTNQDIDFVYGEKFSTIPYDPQNPSSGTGMAINFKMTMPTIMWHKSTGSNIGLELFIDSVIYPNLCNVNYIKSKPNVDMNDPGLRYYHLWDNNPDAVGNVNRVGKVFPDQQIIVIDDEELVAAMSYKSNRNWTLPAPKLSLVTPNICVPGAEADGIMTGTNETMWVTYRFDTTAYTSSLHCNYYSSIIGPSTGCTDTSQNVGVRFGPEFPFLKQGGLSGFSANSLKLLVQKTATGLRPDPTLWREIDVTNEISATTISNYLTMSGITGATFEITKSKYQNGSIYNLSNYIDLTPNNSPDILNFGDEYYFYGNIETDISATIYEMKFLVTLNQNQFTNTSNPTWTTGTKSYVTEIGLLNAQKELLVISKLQSPQLRQGIQQYVVKLDF
jgi:hypothetical protein